MCILAPFRAQINTQIQEKHSKILLFSEQFYVFSFISLQRRCHDKMIFTFRICKYTHKFIFWHHFVHKYTHKFKKNIKRFYCFQSCFMFFSFISLQIRCHNEMIFTFRICKHVEEDVSYKYVYFGTISCTNKDTKSRKISKGFAVFRAGLCFFVYFSANTMSYQNDFNVPHL